MEAKPIGRGQQHVGTGGQHFAEQGEEAGFSAGRYHYLLGGEGLGTALAVALGQSLAQDGHAGGGAYLHGGAVLLGLGEHGRRGGERDAGHRKIPISRSEANHAARFTV